MVQSAKITVWHTIFISDQKLPEDVNKLGIFANDELSLGEIDVYGYDYDYTLAAYKKATVEKMIHSLAKKGLTFDTSCPKNAQKSVQKEPIFFDPFDVIKNINYKSMYLFFK